MASKPTGDASSGRHAQPRRNADGTLPKCPNPPHDPHEFYRSGEKYCENCITPSARKERDRKRKHRDEKRRQQEREAQARSAQGDLDAVKITLADVYADVKLRVEEALKRHKAAKHGVTRARSDRRILPILGRADRPPVADTKLDADARDVIHALREQVDTLYETNELLTATLKVIKQYMAPVVEAREAADGADGGDGLRFGPE